MDLGKGIMEDVLPFVDYILANAEEHQDWPDGAEFKVSYRTKCWPHGFDDTRHVYFDTPSQVEAWERNYAEWARGDGSSIEFTVYRWDLGPNVVKHDWY